MTITQRVTSAVNGALPDRRTDPLIDADRVVGLPMSRIDGAPKVSGTARFTADIALDGMVFATLVCSTIAKGRISAIDDAAARRAPGVIAIMTHENAPEMAPPNLMALGSEGAAGSSLPVMQSDAVRWNGQPVAVVVAETQEEADHAASLVEVSYEPAPADLSFAALVPHAQRPEDVLGQPSVVERGDADAAFQNAEVQLRAVYRTPRHSHAAIEPHVTTAHWEGPDRLTVYDSSQALGRTRYDLARVFGLREKNVRVVAQFVGGAFGNKNLWNHQLLCTAAAKIVGRPVRLALRRADVVRITGGRTLTEQYVALGAGRDGTLRSLVHDGVSGVVSHNGCPEQFSVPARHLYAADTYRIGQRQVLLDMVANAAMRAPGDSVGTFALESALDELAIELGIDPVELRRRIEPEVDPTDGKPFSTRNLLEAYRRGAERFGWARRNREPGSQRDGHWRIGHGVASAFYPYLRMPGGAARIRLTADGRAVVTAAAHEMGMGTATVQVQHAAERLGLPVECVSFEYGDTDLPGSPVAAGSAQTASLVSAVTAASTALVKELLKLAGRSSPIAGLRPKDVTLRNAGVHSAREPGRGESYRAILRRAGRDHVEVEAKPATFPLEFLKYSMHSYGAQFCEVRVHDVTGEVRVSRWVGSFDVGRVLNPKTTAGQLRGAIIMGIGSALSEETLFDERSGRFMNPSLTEYHVPVHADVPDIDVLWTGIPDPHAPLGLHGVGEVGITGVAAAVANAVHNATGTRIRELPITLDKLLTGYAPA
jgi:xanthine dehydrogenase YagR molybdenum-binding subunit